MRDVAASIHFSEHSDPDTLSILHDWASGKPATINDFVIAMPAIAHDVMQYVAKTGDTREQKAWFERSVQLNQEHSYTITRKQRRAK